MYYVYRTRNTPTIKESLDMISKKEENIIIDNKNLTASAKNGIHVINRDYYYWKGPILQGIEYLECRDCYDISVEKCCTVCEVNFYSTYLGSNPQLCNTCLAKK
jgi:hypothetical protein